MLDEPELVARIDRVKVYLSVDKSFDEATLDILCEVEFSLIIYLHRCLQYERWSDFTRQCLKVLLNS